MKKHLKRSMAALLVLVMVLTMLPAMAFATNVGEGASFMSGVPADGSYGTIYSCGEGYSHVIGYDLGEGNAPALAVEKTEDGEAVKALPDGTMVIKFVKTGNDYYFMVGSKYLVLKDLDSSNKEKLILSDTAEKGAKWTIKADQAGMEGAYNIMNAEYKWNGKYDVYLEQYNGQKFCGYSYSGGDKALYFQFKFLACSADEDGRVGERAEAAAKPENGDTVVIYNEAAAGVFGQQTGPEAPKQNLTVAAATLGEDGTLLYDDIADGALIFQVSVKGNEYTFKTGDKYLGMTENYTNDQGKISNDESLILLDAENEYTKWTLSEINGGWLLKNKTAVWGSNGIVVEFFGDLFCGYSYYAGDDTKYALNFYKVTDKYDCGYVVNPSIAIDEPAPAIGSDCTVKFTVNDLNEIKELQCKYGTDSGVVKSATPEMNGKNGVFTIPAADLEGAKTVEITVSAIDSMDLAFNAGIKVEVKDEPLVLEITPAANSATGTEKRPEISATFANIGENATIELLLDSEKVTPTVSGNKLSYKPAADLTEGKHSVALTITRADSKSVTKNWSFFIGEGGETLYFGQIHAHTAEYSDGAGTLEQAYEHAHDVADMDYIIITDHSNYFDTTKTATYTSYYNLESLTMNAAGTVTKWEEARATADYYNKLYDDFICMYGYEMTWSGGPGHTNSFNTYGTLSRNNTTLNNKTNYAGMLAYDEKITFADKGLDETGKAEAKTNRYESYSAEMKGGSLEIKREGDPVEVTGVNATKYIPFDANGDPVPVVSQFNHPGTTFGTFGDFMGYTAQRDDQLNLVEVGNGEGKVGGSSYFPSYGEYDKALGMGWHLAPTNNQDNHKGNWGDSNTCRDVVLTDDFSEIGIYRALDARRVYSTEDQNLEVYYELKVGDSWYKLGDIAAVSEENQPANVTAKVSINDPDSTDAIATVEIIGEGGKTLSKVEATGNSFVQEITVPNNNAYYYIRIVEKDGDIAVTAPVWTKESIPANVSIKTDASVAAQGVEENVIATFTNGSETETMKLTKYTIKADGETLLSEEVTEDVAPGAVKTLTVPYTPAKTNPETTKSYQITVWFKFEYKGKEYTYSQKLTETSYPPSQMTYIGLDSGHKNFYVSGDYANCDTSFIQICADNGIICEYIKEGEMTKENLAKYKLVVISTPRISESVAPPLFTAEELAALKDFTDNGGSIINLSKSDRYDYTELGEDGKDTYKYASANISNMVNEAIGAKARFVRGIVVDNDKKANEAYRIYFDGAELLADDHPFTKAIFAATNGEYQWYNGTGITPNGAKTLVKPYDSSWVACYKDNFDGSAYVPDYDKDTVMAKKGEFGLVTYEELPGGGFLVCAGAAFISTYDLKTDTPASQQYENYQMVLNILEYVKNGNKVIEPEITPIAEVHKGKVDQQFTIEGWITSNASDYDKDTAFFDCIYIQDATRGINAFPVSGYYYIGEHVQAHGAVTYYNGEIELNLKPEFNGWIKVVGNDINVLEPAKVSCAVAMADNSIGNLMQISGVVKDIHRTEGVVDYIYVDDGSGTIGTLFINAYIQGDYKGLDDIEVGMSVTGVGIGSRDVDETGTSADGFIRRLRVRNREEIVAYFDPCADFTDVNRNSWYHDGVDYVVENGIMNGLSTTLFGPTNTMNRGMLVTVLYRMVYGKDGSAEFTGKTDFSDVDPARYYAPAVEWASKNGIVKGYEDNTFRPNDAVTREQLATFMYRYAEYCRKDTSLRAELDYPDAAQAHNYAVEPLQWAVAVGLLNGVATNSGVTYLQPLGTTTRGQVATVLMRFDGMDIDDKDDIVILYTNDVHCGVDNSATSFGYAGLAAYRNDQKELHDYVGLVDAGDFIQGEAIGSLSKGNAIITLMNTVGYEAATLGNHEFDYGVDNIVELRKQAEFPIVSANFTYTGPEGAENVADLAPYAIAWYGETKIAYVGITTPESLVKSTPTYFQDEEGQWIYDFANDKTGAALYTAVQTAVDAARAEGADYVIALAHLGVDEGSAPWRSTDVIRNTKGIDVVLDGHSHSVIPQQIVPNSEGEDVILTSTGTKLANIGVLTITEDGELSTKLIGRKDYDKVDEEVAKTVADLEKANEELLNQVVVENLPINLTINNPDRLDEAGNPVRAVRYQETNLGDVCADAYVEASGADIAFVNGGGVRQDIKAGNVTFNDIIKVHPFGNELVVVKATGAQILDALEMAARNAYINEAGLVDGENGGFLQVSGIKYTIFTGTKSTVQTDAAAMFAGVAGDRRVGNVQVYNKTTGAWEPIDPEKTYTLASHDYMLKSGGDGLNMFMKCEIVRDGGMLDNEVLINYFNSDTFKTRLADGVYNNWYGEGRITITKDEATQAADKTALRASIEKAEALTEEDYTAETWAALAAALETAKTVSAKADATQEEIDAAAAALDAAIAALEKEGAADTTYELTTTVKDGDQIIIYHPSQGMALSNELNGTKVNGVAVEVKDGVLTLDADGKTAIYTVEMADETNFRLKMEDGKYLTTGEKGNSMSFEETPNDYSLWYLEVKNAEAGTVFVRSTNASYNGTDKNQALEYYSGYTTYGWKDSDAYTFQIYGAVRTAKTYQLNTKVAADDQIIIYHPSQGMALSNELNGTKVNGVAVEVKDGVLTPDADGKTAIYKVEMVDETNFRLKMEDGKYLTTGEKGNSMSFEETPNDYSLWYLEVKNAEAGTVFVRSTNASYNGTDKNQALEYYSGYTTYGWKDSDAYTFQIYVLTGNAAHPADHETENRPAVDPTCTTVGYTAGVWCKTCNKWVEGHKEIEALGHVDANSDGKCDRCSGKIYTLVNNLVDGDKLLIVSPTSNMVMTDEAAGTEEKPCFAGEALTPVNDTVALADGSKAAFFEVEEYTDSIYGKVFYLKLDGKYLTSDAPNVLKLTDAPTDGSKWQVKTLENGVVGLRNVVTQDERNVSLEYYNGNFTTYKWSDGNNAYYLQLFH